MRRSHAIILVLIALLAAQFAWPTDANAAMPTFWPVLVDPQSGDICPNTGFVKRIVMCLQHTIVFAVTQFLLPLSAFMSQTIAAACLFSIIIFAFPVMLGKQRRLKGDTLMLAIKLGVVMMMTWNFGGWFPSLILAENAVIESITSFTLYTVNLSCAQTDPNVASMWDRLDCSLDRLVGGILPGSMLFSGVVGFIVGSMVSGPIGFTIFIIGVGLLYLIIMAIGKSCYIFLSSIVGISLMVLFSFLFFPCLLFRATLPYFQKWFRLTLGLCLQPIFMMVYISMLLIALDVVVFSGKRSLYATIAGPSSLCNVPGEGIRVCPNFRIGNYMIATGSYAEKSMVDQSLSLNPQQLGFALGVVDTGVFGKMGKWANNLAQEKQIMVGENVGVDFATDAVDYKRLALLAGEANLTFYLVKVLLAILIAGIVAYIFYTMLDFVPYLSTMLSGEVMSIPNLGQSFDARNMGKGFEDLRNKLGGFGKQEL